MSEELIEFLKANIRSVRQLETLLWLQANAQRGWSSMEISKALYCLEDAAAKWLETFHSLELLSVSKENPPQYQWKPKDEVISERMKELAREYRIRPLRVINILALR